MATEVIRTVQPSGGDYTTLTAWEAGEQRDLVAADEIATAECYDFALTDDVAINGWTTDATRFIKIYSPTAERHNGTARAVSGSGFSITPSGTVTTPIRVAVPHVYLEGLEIVGAATAVPTIIASAGVGELYIDQCIIHDVQTGTGYTVSLSTAGVALRMRNTIVYGSCRSADVRNATSALLENCTFYRHAAQLGVLGNSTLTVRNCYSGHAGGASEDWWTGGSAPTGNNNASSDSSAATDYTSTVTSVASSVFVSVTSGSEDFHLQTGTNALVGAGADLTASFTVDIDGDTRPSGSAWDIGADHRAAAGGSFSTTGALTAQTATVAGTAAHLTLHTTTGALLAQSAVIAGTAAHPHIAAGILAAQEATVAGAATAGAVFTTSGALEAGAATVAGSATHLTLHTATGALVAQAAEVAGTAVHITVHASTGALVAGSATVVGAAESTAPNVFDAAGALSAQSASVVGSAARFALHTSEGAIAAGPATVSGLAAHLTLHTSSGALVAGNAAVAGSAFLGDEPVEPEPDPIPASSGGGRMPNYARKSRAAIEAREAETRRALEEETLIIECITALVTAGVIA